MRWSHSAEDYRPDLAGDRPDRWKPQGLNRQPCFLIHLASARLATLLLHRARRLIQGRFDTA